MKRLVCFGEKTWIRIKEILSVDGLKEKKLGRISFKKSRVGKKGIRRKPAPRRGDVDVVKGNGNGWSDGFASFKAAPLREIRIDEKSLTQQWRRVKEYKTQVEDDSWNEKLRRVKEIVSNGR